MRIPQVQFTVRWMMRGIAVIAVLLALLVAAGRFFDNVTADFYKRIRLDPSGSDYRDHAAAWSGMKEYGKAIAEYNEAIRLAPDSPYAYHGRAVVWSAKLEYDKAINDFNDAIRLYSIVFNPFHDGSESGENLFQSFAVPLLADAHYGRGNVWLAKKEYDKALADYTEFIHLNPRLPTAYTCRGAVWQLKGECNKALADYSEAIRIDPGMLSAYQSRAWIWAAYPDPGVRDGTKAVESASNACELTHWNDSSSLEALAAAYAEVGEFDLAVKSQTQAIAAFTKLGESDDQRARLMLYQEKKPYRTRHP
jgi:tetratricopeptide (TPR) repeat protein